MLEQFIIERASPFFLFSIFSFNRLTVDTRLKNRYKRGKNLLIWNSLGKYHCGMSFHMNTLKEKITFILTALAYILFHLALLPGHDGGYRVDLYGTTMTLMNTLPFEIGLTYLIIVFVRRVTNGERPPWDRILRIFFTIGIIFGLIYNLYVWGAREQQKIEQKKISVSRSWEDDTRRMPLYLA